MDGDVPIGPMVVLEERHLSREGVGVALRAIGPSVMMHTVDSRTTSIDDDEAFLDARASLETIASEAGCGWHMHFGTPSAQTIIASGEFGTDLIMDFEGTLWREVAPRFDGRVGLTRY